MSPSASSGSVAVTPVVPNAFRCSRPWGVRHHRAVVRHTGGSASRRESGEQGTRPGLAPACVHQARAPCARATRSTHLVYVFALLLLEAQLVVDVAEKEARHRALPLVSRVGTHRQPLSCASPSSARDGVHRSREHVVCFRTSSSLPPLLLESEMKSSIVAAWCAGAHRVGLCVTRARALAVSACVAPRNLSTGGSAL